MPIFQPRISVVLMCLSAKFWPFLHAILSRSPPFTNLEQEALPQQNQILKSVVEKETSHVIRLLFFGQSDKVQNQPPFQNEFATPFNLEFDFAPGVNEETKEMKAGVNTG